LLPQKKPAAVRVGARGRRNSFTMTLRLCQLPNGAIGRIHALTGESEFCQRLRELGFGESALVTKVGGTGPFLCQINGARIALGHGAAARIVVRPIR
jgi:ferrous iron transport protein A